MMNPSSIGVRTYVNSTYIQLYIPAWVRNNRSSAFGIGNGCYHSVSVIWGIVCHLQATRITLSIRTT